jgi:hypothetical protein
MQHRYQTHREPTAVSPNLAEFRLNNRAGKYLWCVPVNANLFVRKLAVNRGR